MFPEVPRAEVREVLRLWRRGHALRAIARLSQAGRRVLAHRAALIDLLYTGPLPPSAVIARSSA